MGTLKRGIAHAERTLVRKNGDCFCIRPSLPLTVGLRECGDVITSADSLSLILRRPERDRAEA